MRFTLQKIRLNSGGYTSQGYYYGVGQPLYTALSDDCQTELFFRAANRDAAKRYVQEQTPGATFYR